MMSPFYQTHLRSQLNRADYLLFTLLVNLLQSIKQVKLETLATALPLPITFESRRKKINLIFVLARTENRKNLVANFSSLVKD